METRPETARKIVAKNADLHLFDHFLCEKEASELYDLLLSQTPWRQDKIKLFGKELPIPRLQAWYGDKGAAYHYSGMQLHPMSWTPELRTLKRRVENIATASFNSVLINLYRTGQDSNGWHADNEPELGKNPVIASLSLGATRRFKLRHNNDKGLVIDFELNHGSLLIMSGCTQTFWKHCVPKTKMNISPRINLTFRKIINESNTILASCRSF